MSGAQTTTQTQGSNGRLPTVTAIVPSRGRPELLRRAVRSIVEQDYDAPIECLVVYDGEEQPPPLDAPPGRSIRVMRNARRAGAAGARNHGALVATGELLAFCDDDDEWLPQKLTRQVAALRRRPEAAVVTAGIYVCYRGNDVARVADDDRVGFDSLLRSRRSDMHTSTFVVRREDFTGRLGLFDESIPGSFGEDYEFLLRAARVAPLAAVREPLARVHWHESSWFAEQWDMLVRAMTYLLAKYPEFAREPRGRARIGGQIAFAHAAAGRRRRGVRAALECLRLDPRQPRAYLALAVASGAVSADDVLARLRRRGRGI